MNYAIMYNKVLVLHYIHAKQKSIFHLWNNDTNTGYDTNTNMCWTLNKSDLDRANEHKPLCGKEVTSDDWLPLSLDEGEPSSSWDIISPLTLTNLSSSIFLRPFSSSTTSVHKCSIPLQPIAIITIFNSQQQNHLQAEKIQRI